MAAQRDETAAIVRQLVPQMQNRCRHFTGIQHDVCKAGVRYTDVQGGTGLPCLRNATAPAPCTHQSFLTDEEVRVKAEARAADLLIGSEGERRAHEAARGVRGGAGVVECPKCGGRLHWSKAAVNGHIWGKCETAGCLAWME